MKLKGIELNGTYRVKFGDECFDVFDEKDKVIYFESSDGFWVKRVYDEKGNEIYFGSSDGFWVKRVYYDYNIVYYENSNGRIIDKRVKELTVEEIERLLGYKIKIKGETKNDRARIYK